MRRIYIRAAGFRVQTLENILFYKWPAIDITDLAVTAVEKTYIAVTRDVDQSGDGLASALEIHDNGRGNFIPIPRIVRVVLEVAFDFARQGSGKKGGHVERYHP